MIGSEGRIRATNNGVDFELWRRVGEGREAELARCPFPRPQWLASPGVMAVRDFIAVIETGKAPNATGQDGVAHLEAILALRESHRRGGVRVDLPLADRSLRILSSELKFERAPGGRPPHGHPGRAPWEVSTVAVPRIRHLAIRCRDVDRSVRFYRDGLGFKEVGPRGSGVDLSDETLNLTILPFVGSPAPAPEEGLEQIHFGIVVADSQGLYRPARASSAS